jgi:hypothetical protein
MNRSGYSDDIDDNWSLIRWRGAVASAIRGRRGQAFLREMLAALDAMPYKRLITEDLVADGEVCALGAVGAARGYDMVDMDPEDRSGVAGTFGIAEALAAEIMFINDEPWWPREEQSPEVRWSHVRAWVAAQIVATP